jgi:tetratricopeptide (TPR) repeat protein
MSELEHGATGLAAAERFIEIGRPDRALEILAGLDADTAAEPRARLLRGFALYGAERFAETVEVVADALDDDPESPPLLYLLSLAHEQLGNLGQAERAVLSALELMPEDVEVLCQYASVLMRGGQLEKAERLVGEAAARDPDSPDVLAERISLAYLRGDDRRARALTQEMLALDPEAAQGHRMLGTLALNRGEAAEAAERFAESVRSDPSNEVWADDARQARRMTSFWFWPARFFTRYGVAQTWIGMIVVTFGLRAAGLGAVAGIVVLVWLVVCVWSWILAFAERDR